ncbi:hypothetical protein SAMN06298224_2100 [Fibrobacter sp. UWB16]|nr:hypothetical protein [Fibrobacter sp.]OWV17830.1 hypothetical protein B7991_11450 [Fibrobacter sp. UWB3]SOD15593.1 hypothetical protein SAMN06298224_2100 [Fibrobacter sp. UWB16]
MLSKVRSFLSSLWGFLDSTLTWVAVFVVVIAVVFFFFSKTPPKTDERLVAAFVEMRAAEQLYGGETPTGRLARREILNKYGYTRDEFIKACDKVLDDGNSWVPFQMAVSDRVDSLLGIPKVVPVQKKGKK